MIIIRTFKFPSAVIRSLLHVPQKCSDIEVINPNLPSNPGIAYPYSQLLNNQYNYHNL